MMRNASISSWSISGSPRFLGSTLVLISILLIASSLSKIPNGQGFVSAVNNMGLCESCGMFIKILIPVAELLIGLRIVVSLGRPKVMDLLALGILASGFLVYHLLRLFGYLAVNSCGCLPIADIDLSPASGVVISTVMSLVGFLPVIRHLRHGPTETSYEQAST